MIVKVGAQVAQALANGEPVLALESTIITHGLPRPANLQVALESEDLVRAAGATPATIGVFRGQPIVGLDRAELSELAADSEVVKLSIRDLPIAVTRRLSGGTTVAATAKLACDAGIKVFSTGGLGGVHRGATTTFDESADLVALSRCPIVLVSAGVKSLLDVGATLERLETLSVPVVGYRTTHYPGFYVADSGFSVDYAVQNPFEIAELAAARDQLGLLSALLVARPIDPEFQLDQRLHDQVLDEALAACEANHVTGHDITPFLLDYMQQHTGGASLEANLAAYRGNLTLGSEIAQAIAGRSDAQHGS